MPKPTNVQEMLRSRTPGQKTREFLERAKRDSIATPATLQGNGLAELQAELRALYGHFDEYEDDFQLMLAEEADEEIRGRLPEYEQKARAAKACINQIREQIRRLAKILREHQELHERIADPILADPPATE